MTVTLVLVLSTLALAWANGANDVSKGVAVLAGSGVASPRTAWILGVGGNAAGGLAAIHWGNGLGALFGGGFLNGAPELPVEAALAALIGAASFILIATWRRWPVSTTHALIGGIIGAALVRFGAHGVAYYTVLQRFLVPLLLSPILAIGLCWLLLRVNRALEARLPRWTPGCCDRDDYESNPFVCAPAEKRPSRVVQQIWLAIHWLSGGAVSFARGLNDVPKIAALMMPALVAFPALSPAGTGAAIVIVLTTAAMSSGALVAGRRLLPVLANGVSNMTQATGLFANVGTAFLVLGATPLGLPVSTTHVATGSLIGIRVADNAPPKAMDALYMILMAWIVTLPVSAAIAAAVALAGVA